MDFYIWLSIKFSLSIFYPPDMLAISKIETSSCSYRDNLFSIIQSQVIVQLKLKITPNPPPKPPPPSFFNRWSRFWISDMFESTQQHISHFLEHSWWLKLCFKIIMLSEKKKKSIVISCQCQLGSRQIQILLYPLVFISANAWNIFSCNAIRF